MTSRSTDSLRNMCRTCLSTLSGLETANNTTNKQCIYEVPIGSEEGISIMELLQLVQPLIKVQIKDDLPKLMCSDCIKKLQVTHEFLEMYKEVDKKFRKMLKEVDINDSTSSNFLESLDESEEFIEEKYDIDNNAGQLDDEEAQEIANLEIEKVNEDFSKQQVEEYENMQAWPEFEDEQPIHEITDEEEKLQHLVNPYSDASDEDWKPDQTSKNQTLTKISPKKRKTDFKINNTSKNFERKKSRKRKDIQEIQMPLQNEDGSISCEECEAILENVVKWQEHMREHRLGKLPKRKNMKKTKKPLKTYKCEHCDKEFNRLVCYRNHERIHTGEEPFLCIECGKSFKALSSLNTHMLRHKGIKNIQCPHCPKKFVCSSGLYGHMMVHTKEKPFVCDICGQSFHMAYMLRKHNLYHNNIRNYPCEYCDMRFVTGEKQRRHMRTHTGEKPYSCKYCERAFAQSNDCIKHLRQHLGDNVYQCELCPLRFPMARDLRVHFASHKDDDEETRTRNLEARMEEERNLKIKLGVPDI